MHFGNGTRTASLLGLRKILARITWLIKTVPVYVTWKNVDPSSSSLAWYAAFVQDGTQHDARLFTQPLGMAAGAQRPISQIECRNFFEPPGYVFNSKLNSQPQYLPSAASGGQCRHLV